MGCAVVLDGAELLGQNLENPNWDQLAQCCLACGRCITWCPIGIDITDQVQVIRDGEEGD